MCFSGLQILILLLFSSVGRLTEKYSMKPERIQENFGKQKKSTGQ